MFPTLIISTHGGWLGALAGAVLDAVLGGISCEIYGRVGRMFEMDQRGRGSSRQASEVAGNGARRMVGGLKREDGSV
jgi:hypothetical protein